MIGTVLMERYRLEERIGEGGMSAVYRALDLRTGHRVAVKFLRQELQENPEFLDRFRREATAASRMSHHNIVNLLDIGDNASAPYLVFEFVDGKTLKDIIVEHGRLPQATAVQIAIRILSALRHAHEAGVIHRDIKPQNILVDREGYIKVSDFGIARMVGANSFVDEDGKQSVMGSVHYFSPEQARGETASNASDIYSVGIVLYEMLTGKVPFEGEAPVAVAMQHLQVDAVPVRSLVPEVSPAVEAVVMKSMSKDPKDRYASAMYMAQALHAALEPDNAGDIGEQPVSSTAKTNGRGLRNRALSLRNRALLLVLGLAITAGVIIAVVLIYRDIVNTTRVPLLIGYTYERALREVSIEGLSLYEVRTPSSEAVDMVITQNRDVGEPIKRGEVIVVNVSSGPARKPVPRLTDLSLEEATRQLKRISLERMVISEIIHPSPPGTVLDQDPKPEEMMDAGGIVQLKVSAGQAAVPELSGLVWTEARDVLKRNKLQIGKIEQIIVQNPAEYGRVASQLPVAGEKVAENTAVDLVVYMAPGITNGSSPGPDASREGGK